MRLCSVVGDRRETAQFVDSILFDQKIGERHADTIDALTPE